MTGARRAQERVAGEEDVDAVRLIGTRGCERQSGQRQPGTEEPSGSATMRKRPSDRAQERSTGRGDVAKIKVLDPTAPPPQADEGPGPDAGSLGTGWSSGSGTTARGGR